VLNVNDSQDNRALRGEILRARGYEVIDAETGLQAVALAVQHQPEVVLLDVKLPDLSGIEVCRRIKAHPPSEHPIIILVSATELATNLVLEGFAAGADIYLRHHLEPSILAGFIDAAAKRRASLVELQYDRAQAQLELGETLRRYRSMFNHAPYGICHVLEDGTFLDGNEAFLDLVGCGSLDEVRALNLLHLYGDATRADVIERWKEKAIGKDEVEWRLTNGQHIHVSVSGRVLEQNAEVFELFVEDVTERKRLEAEFHHKQKMEAIGRLAGGIAHDLNNWLTVIHGYAEMMLADPANTTAREGLEEILSASRAATGVTRNLLTFSRKQIVQLQVIDLNDVVTEFHHLVQRIIGETIQVQVDISPNPLTTKADPTQIQQVLMNLAVNARDAMPKGGRLTVRTGRLRIDDGTLPGANASEGDYALVIVSDNGLGMSAEVRERLFEPFFTTKESGKGTGLGMAVVYGIVKQLGGYITVDSEPGRGTTFTMFFPVVEGHPPSVEERRRDKPKSADGERTCVLLVEDEDPVRMLTKLILERAGYDVMAAATGEEALQVFEGATHAIHLVLTDVVMPGMSGPEMLARMARHRAVPALLMSGYPDQDDLAGDVASLRLIPKPFTADVLTSAVREVLEERLGGAV
jgi:PAS domain S-box-containing protein